MGISASVASSIEKWKGDGDRERDGADGVSRVRVAAAVDGADDVARSGAADGVDDVVRWGAAVVAAVEMGMRASMDVAVAKGFVGSVMAVDGNGEVVVDVSGGGGVDCVGVRMGVGVVNVVVDPGILGELSAAAVADVKVLSFFDGEPAGQ
ncbi:hypothetical protein CBR_g51940 [Chara braunii]|uniref:Uncharacterized protein n=1 Tax=Chara braunii TaxID=69332 RepID=A0A388K6G1_CHABU|nr:hypothetical protein CBR_g51940 [Chara braunii]|eukprot:GBG65640.1 hypothetical protein CBR_g51940 [Chara braunii]